MFLNNYGYLRNDVAPHPAMKGRFLSKLLALSSGEAGRQMGQIRAAI